MHGAAQQTGRFGQQRAAAGRVHQRASSAEEMHPAPAPVLLDPQQSDQPDLARAPHVCATASGPVELVDLHNAHLVAHRGGAAQWHFFSLCLCYPVGANRAVLPNDLVGVRLNRCQLRRRERRTVQVERVERITEMDAHRLQSQAAVERLREQMLPGMLLHMIVTPLPIDLPGNACRLLRQRVGQQMQYSAIRPGLHINDRGAVQVAGVMGLSAGRRIEGRPAQTDRRLTLVREPLGHLRDETGAVGVCVVESLVHTVTLLRALRRRPRSEAAARPAESLPKIASSRWS